MTRHFGPDGQPALRVAVVGCGAVTRHYYRPALEQLFERGWVRTVHYFDPVVENTRRVVADSSFARAESSWQSLLALDADLAIIASPPRFHAQQSIAMLETGKHVLCEKPFTLNAIDAERVIDAVQRNQRLCAVGMVRRFSRTACWLGRLATGGDAAGWKQIEWSEGGPFRWDIGSLEYFLAGSGNALRWDIGAHVIDLLVNWLGEPLHVECRDDAMGGTEANCQLLLEFSGGCRGSVRLSRDTALASRIRIVRQDDRLEFDSMLEGTVAWNVKDSAVELRGELGSLVPHDESLGFEPGATFWDCFLAQLKNVFQSVRGAGTLWVPATSVLAGIRTLERVDARRELLQLPWLDGSELREAKRLRALMGVGHARRP